MNRLSASNIERPLVFHYKNDIIEIFGKQVSKIRRSFGGKSMHVAIYIGVVATTIVIG